MTIYTVHAPPATEGVAPEPERFRFVRDGFHVWAFALGPVWLLAKRLWLALVIYIAVIVALQLGAWLLAVPSAGHGMMTFLLHLLIGLEAATIERWTLNLRGWQEVGVVQGDKLDTAERRFFNSWVSPSRYQQTMTTQASPPGYRMPQAPSDIVGLFPEPQSRQ